MGTAELSHTWRMIQAPLCLLTSLHIQTFVSVCFRWVCGNSSPANIWRSSDRAERGTGQVPGHQQKWTLQASSLQVGSPPVTRLHAYILLAFNKYFVIGIKPVGIKTKGHHVVFGQSCRQGWPPQQHRLDEGFVCLFSFLWRDSESSILRIRIKNTLANWSLKYEHIDWLKRGWNQSNVKAAIYC